MKKLLAVLALSIGLAAAAHAQLLMRDVGSGGTGGAVASLSCTYTPVTTATYNVAYTGGTPAASGGTPAYVFSNTGTLPPGFTINTTTGVISGTDVVDSGGATYPGIQVSVLDSLSNTANCGTSFTITVSAGGSFSLSYVSNNHTNSSASSYTYTGQSIGTADSARYVEVCAASFLLSNPTPPTITSMTIGGVNAASVVTNGQNLSGNGNATEVWGALVTTGTTATIVINYTTNPSRIGIAVYELHSPTGSPVTASNQGNSSGFNTTLTIPSGGASVGCAFDHDASAIATTPTGFNADGTVLLTGTTQPFTFAHSAAGVLTGSQNLHWAFTGSTGTNLAVAAAWGP